MAHSILEINNESDAFGDGSITVVFFLIAARSKRRQLSTTSSAYTRFLDTNLDDLAAMSGSGMIDFDFSPIQNCESLAAMFCEDLRAVRDLLVKFEAKASGKQLIECVQAQDPPSSFAHLFGETDFFRVEALLQVVAFLNTNLCRQEKEEGDIVD